MAWLFDQSISGKVEITDDAALVFPDGDWSLGGWFKSTGAQTQNFPYLFSQDIFSANNSFSWFERSGSNDFRALLEDGSGNLFDLDSTSDVFLNTDWQHVMLVRSGDTLTQYINGASDGTDTNAAVGAINATTITSFGRRTDDSGNTTINGNTAEWGKWDRALSAGTDSEIAALVLGFAPTFFMEDLKFYLPMWNETDTEKLVPLILTYENMSADDHPGQMIYPSRPLVIPSAAAPPPTGNPWNYYAQQAALAG